MSLKESVEKVWIYEDVREAIKRLKRIENGEDPTEVYPDMFYTKAGEGLDLFRIGSSMYKQLKDRV